MSKWNIRFKRYTIVSVMTLAWVVLLISKESTAITLAPYQYALVLAFCGLDTLRKSE